MKPFKKTVLILFLILFFGTMPIIVWGDWESRNNESWESQKSGTYRDESWESQKPGSYSDKSWRTKERPCSYASMKTFSGQTTYVGKKIAIRGRGFGKETGEVIFNKNVPAKVISWSARRIWVLVPEGAVTGNIQVIKTCPSGSFAVSQYIKIEKPKSE